MSEYTQLKFWLIKNNISQVKIANDTGLHKNTVSNLVRTGKGTKSVKELTRLYLGITKEEFTDLLLKENG